MIKEIEILISKYINQKISFADLLESLNRYDNEETYKFLDINKKELSNLLDAITDEEFHKTVDIDGLIKDYYFKYLAFKN